MLIDQLSFSGLRAIRFRPFNHTGRGQSPDFVVPAFAQQAANIEAGLVAPKIVVGNLDARRDFLDVRDVVRAYAVAATTADPAALGAVFNLATGTPLRIGDILAFLLEKIGVDVAIETDPARMRPSEIPIASGDPSRVAESLGWSPSIGFEETMTQVLDFYRALTKQTTRLL
jgi:GDP-4-dehydro-6-deoxy-D-mannose reductase